MISEYHDSRIPDHRCHEEIINDELDISFDREEFYFSELISECFEFGIESLEKNFKIILHFFYVRLFGLKLVHEFCHEFFYQIFLIIKKFILFKQD